MKLEEFKHLPRIKIGQSRRLISIKNKNLVLTELAEINFSPKAYQEKYVLKQMIPSSKESLFYLKERRAISQYPSKGIQKLVYVFGINDNLEGIPGGESAELCFVESVIPVSDIKTTEDIIISKGLGFNELYFIFLDEIRGYKAINYFR